jgi:hypothetical protein
MILALAGQQSPAHGEQTADDHAYADVLGNQVPVVEVAEDPRQNDERAENELTTPPALQ